MVRPRIGLALRSGSARGWSHVGIIEALAEAGIEPDIVCGSSIGALVGASYVADRLAALKEWAEFATWREIVSLLDIQEVCLEKQFHSGEAHRALSAPRLSRGSVSSSRAE